MASEFKWDKEKNSRLRKERGVSFEAVAAKIDDGDILDVLDGTGKYSHQRQFVVELGGYAYIVPFVEDGERIFLKTIYPSRKMTKRYLGRLG